MFRTLAVASTRTVRTVNLKPFSLSFAQAIEGPQKNLSTNSKTKTEAYPDDKHAVNKTKEGDTHNVQESNAKAGME